MSRVSLTNPQPHINRIDLGCHFPDPQRFYKAMNDLDATNSPAFNLFANTLIVILVVKVNK